MVLQNVGIYTSKHSFLAASPYGIITDNGVNCGIIAHISQYDSS